jgi:hypothetical protein
VDTTTVGTGGIMDGMDIMAGTAIATGIAATGTDFKLWS